jgi:hypothetical protein
LTTGGVERWLHGFFGTDIDVDVALGVIFLCDVIASSTWI